MEFDELLITTGVDALVRLVKEREKIELEGASSILNIPPETLEDWARVLEEEGILRIEYRLTKIFLVWIKPTEEEIATEAESFYEEKEGIIKEVESFRQKMGARQKDLESLQASFADFYAKTHKRMEELDKKVASLPSGELMSEGASAKSDEELTGMGSELQEVKRALEDMRKEVDGLGLGKESSPSEELVGRLDGLDKDLQAMQDEMKEMRKQTVRETPEGVSMPSMRDIKKKLEAMNKDFSALRSRNARLREDMVSLHESSQILQDVAESIMGQEEKIKAMHDEIAAVSSEADKVLKKATEINEKVKQNQELVGRLGDSVTVSKGILKRFPTQKKVMEELDALQKNEDDLAGKCESMEKLIQAVGGKQLTAKQFAELSKKMDIKIEQMRRDMDSLEAVLEDEKSTYLTFQKIKERIVPSIESYQMKLSDMEGRIARIADEADAQKATLKADAKKLKESLKGGEMKDVLKMAEEIRGKKKMLDEIKDSLDDLVTLSENLHKRITLLSREAKLLQIRAGEKAPPPTPATETERKEIRRQLELTKDEEMEFRRKREELKKLIKRLWEE